MSAIWSSDAVIWLGIIACLSQSAMFSGLNLALLGISRLRLEVEASTGNPAAVRILKLRQDTNFLLSTILWGNVGINVLLTLLSSSVLAGVSAFLFSTVFITFFGEIAPQAYFSRHALRVGSLLAPVLRLYQVLLYPVAKPSALVLDWALGKEGVQYFREQHLRILIQKHIDAGKSDIDRLEGIGALNFLALDDLIVGHLGEKLDPLSVIELPHRNGQPVFPEYQASMSDPFIRAINASGRKWVVVGDVDGTPSMVINTDEFLRALFSSSTPVDIRRYCHRPVVERDTRVLFGQVLYDLIRATEGVEKALVLVWADQKRVITGSDILSSLLSGAAHPAPAG